MGTTRAGLPDDVDPVVALGRRIHDLRCARGFSLQEFAALAELTAPVLSALERGERSTTVAAVFAAAEALELAPADLFAAGEFAASAPAVPGRAVSTGAPRDRRPLALPDPSEPEPAAAMRMPATSVRAPYGEQPPPGYVPLEMPELWEPAAAPGAGDASPPVAPMAAAAPVAAAPVATMAPLAPAPVATAPPAAHRAGIDVIAKRPAGGAPPSRGPAPRTFADLRQGPLAGRVFETLPQFAVAAVVEAGHPVSVVAAIFRIPTWRLEGWVRDGVPPSARPAPGRR